MASDESNKLRLFIADLQELLWRHKAELSVGINVDRHRHDSAELLLYFSSGWSCELPSKIIGKEPVR